MRKPHFLRLVTLASILKFILFTTSTAFADDNAVRAELFDIEAGLSQSAVSSLMLDSYGFLWIGTQDGLNRYNGYTFKAYRNNPLDKTTLCNNNINSICEDNDKNLWIGTWNGLSYYNRSDNVFKNYFHDPDDVNSLSSNRVFHVFQDSYGIVWIKTLESLDRYDPSTDSFIRYPHFSDPFSFTTENNDFKIFEDSQQRLWVGTKDGLMLFNRKLGLFKRYHHDTQNSTLSSNRIKDIHEDHLGYLWVATSKGLNRLSPDAENVKRYYHNPNNSKSLLDNIVNAVFQDTNGTLWIGTDKGLCSYNYDEQSFIPRNIFVNGNKLYSTNVTTIVEDSSNIIWFGSQSGLLKLDNKEQKFKLYSKRNDGSNIFSGNSVASILEDSKGRTWVGTWGTGLHLFNRQTEESIVFTENHPTNRIVNDYVHAIIEDSNGQVIIGTRNGVQVFDEAKSRFVDFFVKQDVDASSIFSENRIYSIREDKYENLWFATSIGLHRFDGDVLRSFYYNPDDSTSLSSNEVHAIAPDGDTLWVGTFNGLNLFNLKSLQVEKIYQTTESKLEGLITNDIVSLHVAQDGTLWVGTASGLHSYNKENQKFTLFTEIDGLPNNLIYAIEEDVQGNIWISTNWGLAVLKKDGSIVSYGVSDGLQSYEFNVGASYKSNSGELFFGGISGLNAFHPESIRINQNIPPIVITSFEVIDSKGAYQIPVVGNERIEIKQGFSLINIEFAALDFTRPQSNLYEYRMEGLENEWVSIGTRHYATFSNLTEGKYVFRVRGSNSDGVWNKEGVFVEIYIVAPFWKSKLAFWLYGVIFVLSLVFFLRTRTRMLRKTSRLLKEREFTMVEMESQKEELLSKNKSITDSINYAKRIQEALIPTSIHFRKILPDSFILYMPKDIVSGDFYWINETENKVFVAVIDCTGHGVPGAFMSIIGVELLRNIINVMGVSNAAEILNRLDKGVHETFSKTEDEETMNVKDGMDVSFSIIDKEKKTIQFAGAFSNLYLVRDSKIIEIKGDRYTVGIGYETNKPLFTNHEIEIQPKDMIYMFTDGYVDQFGGSEGKKYKFRRFRHLLLSIHKYPMDIQRKYLLGSINEWKGNLEQVDDILIVGIRPDLSCEI